MATTLSDIIEHLSDELNGKTPIDRLRQEFGAFENTIKLDSKQIKHAVNMFKAHVKDDDPKLGADALIKYIRETAKGIEQPELPNVTESVAKAVPEHPHFSTKIKENFKGSTSMEKGMRVTSAGVGAVLLGKAILSDLQKDHEDNTHPLMALVDGSAGAALLAASLLTRGSRAAAL